MTSYELDCRQSFNGQAEAERFTITISINPSPGVCRQQGLQRQALAIRHQQADRRQGPPSGVRAAIIREKGTNGDREMAYVLYLAGFDVKDVMMTDLISGRETLDDINMIVFCGGFSNSDVLGSCQRLGRRLPLQSQGQGSARPLLCAQGHALSGRLQRMPAHDRA
jgi:phosphoribosylformylglycinamidine synthase